MDLAATVATRGKRLQDVVLRAIDTRWHPGRASPREMHRGKQFFGHFVELCGLRPDARVLDVGCGGGGPATYLAEYLSSAGEYHGFDVRPLKIDYCRRTLGAAHPNFHFQCADIYNENYNPEGRYGASSYVFPYPDSSFDFVFLISVFTHMVATDVENYTSQIARVLRPGGTCLVTYFLLNDETRALMASGASRRSFAHDFGEYRAEFADVAERVVAYDEQQVRDRYARHGLEVVDPIHYGSWSGRRRTLYKQDVVIATKR